MILILDTLGPAILFSIERLSFGGRTVSIWEMSYSERCPLFGGGGGPLSEVPVYNSDQYIALYNIHMCVFDNIQICPTVSMCLSGVPPH